MGQRHQLFVIANINGRYRTLCAIHHQWLYGQTALKRCLATLKIFADPANKVPLEQELIAARLHDEAFWTATTATRAEYDKKNSHVPFPFIATCLVTGASFDAEEGYYHGVLMEPFDMAYDEGDNNNGKESIVEALFANPAKHLTSVCIHASDTPHPIQKLDIYTKLINPMPLRDNYL